MADKMCPYRTKKIYSTTLAPRSGRAVEIGDTEYREHGYRRRVRVTCPLCGRRLFGWKAFTHDAELVSISVPVHKRKKWWKKKETQPDFAKARSKPKWRKRLITGDRRNKVIYNPSIER